MPLLQTALPTFYSVYKLWYFYSIGSSKRQACIEWNIISSHISNASPNLKHSTIKHLYALCRCMNIDGMWSTYEQKFSNFVHLKHAVEYLPTSLTMYTCLLTLHMCRCCTRSVLNLMRCGGRLPSSTHTETAAWTTCQVTYQFVQPHYTDVYS